MPDSQPPTIFVVDDEPAVRKSINLILARTGFPIQLFESAVDYLEQFDPLRAGCLITDVRMPGMDGMQLLKELDSRNASLPILMLSAHGDIGMAVRALKLGAIDFLEKPVDPNVLRQKVLQAMEQDELARTGQEELEEIRSAIQTLSPREREVLELLVDGKTAKVIGVILGTAHNTVRVQRANILRKMRADNVVDLIRMVSMLK